jgi:hypothetical protein
MIPNGEIDTVLFNYTIPSPTPIINASILSILFLPLKESHRLPHIRNYGALALVRRRNCSEIVAKKKLQEIQIQYQMN